MSSREGGGGERGESSEPHFSHPPFFHSFVPKIVSIPTQALPIAMISAAGFVRSVDGVSQDQPNSVKLVISGIYIAFPVIMNMFSFWVKLKYPIKSGKTNRLISEGIALHAAGLDAIDPITGEVVPPKDPNLTDEERHLGNILDHFAIYDLRKLCVEANTTFLLRSLEKRRYVAVLLLIGCITGVWNTFFLLEDDVLNFVPSLFQIGIGLSMMYLVIISFRVRAAWNLNELGVDVEFVRNWRATIGDVDKESKPKILQKILKTPEEVIKILKASLQKGKLRKRNIRKDISQGKMDQDTDEVENEVEMSSATAGAVVLRHRGSEESQI